MRQGKRALQLLVVLCLAGPALRDQAAFGQIDFSSIGTGNQNAAALDDPPVTLDAHIARPANGQAPRLVVTANIAPDWHIYSLTQGSGGPVPSKISVEQGTGYKLAGEFTPDEPPEVTPEPAFNNLPVESHEGKVVWSAPLELSAGVDPASLSIPGKFSYQACNASSCLRPKSIAFTAKLGDPQSTAAVVPRDASEKSAIGNAGKFQPAGSHVKIRGHIEPIVAAPGEKARLVITAEPGAQWHVYALADRDTNTGPKPALLVLTQTSSLIASPPVADAQPTEKQSTTIPGTVERYYETPVTWTIELDIPKDAKRGDYKVEGILGFQTCCEGRCDLPQAVRFQVSLPVAAQSEAGEMPLTFTAAKDCQQAADAAAGGVADARDAGFDPDKVQPISEGGNRSLVVMLAFAFIGGVILNCMPCVLPVIGLKILGFVEQSHRSRRAILSLNIWFTLGLLSVFVVLASLAVFLNFGWGEQFTKPWFTVGMAGLVFAMALSFLGVWEIPIPGFVGSGGASDLAAKEGVAGAFAKGVFTTVLATPCSGPFLGPVFGLVLRQPPAAIYAIFISVGLGMASPYVLIGAFPRLIRFLPKPGAWMDTFKQLMGFVLLGTVVFLFMSIKQDYVVPAFALLIGLWMACWWIGRTPLTAELGSKLSAWAIGCVIAAAVGLFAFTWLLPGEDVLPWRPFSRAALAKLTAEGKTVFIDFTADWCPTCKTNERVAINTAAVRDVIDELGIVPLKADWTEESEEIKSMLQLLGFNSIPVYAVFPADRPNQPIIFSDFVTKKQVLEKLREGGRSKDNSRLAALQGPR